MNKLFKYSDYWQNGSMESNPFIKLLQNAVSYISIFISIKLSHNDVINF